MDCFHPVQIRTEQGLQYVKCGHCYACLQHRQQEWIIRLTAQMKDYPYSTYFATLTYNDEHLPTNKVWNSDPEGTPFKEVPSVRKADLQKFHADLRKRFSQGFFYDDTLVRLGLEEVPRKIGLPKDIRFRYYATSEYGPNGGRPHMHAVYFGLPEEEDLVLDLFNAVWRKGFVQVELARSEDAAAYVAKYLVNDSLVPHDQAADSPWSLMSKNLGASYLTPAMVEWHRADPLRRCYVPGKEGGHQVMPRYYRDRLFDDSMKVDILEDKLKRDQTRFDAESRLSPAELSRRNVLLRRKEAESIRQAEWRFKKTGKIK